MRMRMMPFGRHLHNQIVIPLLVVSACVAVVATIVGVVMLQSLIDRWVDGNVRQAIGVAQREFTDIALRLQGDAKAGLEDPDLVRALGQQSPGGVERALARTHARDTTIDDILLLDEDGALLAISGTLPLEAGSRPIADFARFASLDMNYTTLSKLAGHDAIIAVRRNTYIMGNARRTLTMVVATRITWDFLKSNFAGSVAAVGYCDASKVLRARYVDRVGAVRAGSTLTDLDYRAIKTSITGGNDAIRQALAHPDTTTRFSSGGQQFAVQVARIGFTPGTTSEAAAAALDPTDAVSYFFVVLSNSVADEAGKTTVGLIAFWSIVAVLVLTGLGTIIARTVSAPLAELALGARHVAEGDFTVRVETSGVNEIAELAESFNSMTGSLQDRTEALTKKVLELATLYEMSRALGSTLDLDTLLDSVLDSALRIFNVDSGYAMLREKTSGTLTLRAWRGLAGVRPDDRAVRSSMSEWVVRQGRPLIFNPPQGDDTEEHVDSVTGALAALCVPLVSGEGVIGSICIGSRDREFRFSSDDVRLLSTIANHVTIAIGNIELFSSLQDAYLATVRSLAAAVDAKDPYTRGHSDKVASYAKAIAERLDLSGEQCTALEMAAYLHDIGKIGIRESILLKPGKLDADEMGQMRHHPLIGANILKPVAFPWPIAPVVRHHHEHFDGQGYPAGLKGEEIPLLARILTVADAYEAMTADRPYRAGRDQDAALEELRRCEGTHFDPRVVEAFVDALASFDDDAAARRARAVEEIQPEEARAIFVAVCDGMFASFRRLGGPRLASNLETALEESFRAADMPYSLHSGHIAGDWEKAGSVEKQLEDMRTVVTELAHGMEATAGRSLVDHFYDEALSALSERMRHLANVLDLYDRT